MSYQVIARKWRPQIFEQVVGQEAITRTLRNAIETSRLHHAYLFSGARGVGKTTTARILAKALNCRLSGEPNPTPCNTNAADVCVSCKEVAESRSMDVLEFDAASHTKVEEIREIILESININPARDRYKVFIIDEVHMLSKSSFNALLKTLEEPPDNVVFVMATTELHKVPDTILSRCQQFEFRTIPQQKITARLRSIADAENIDITDDALKEIARSGEGSMRDAESNFDQVISFSGESMGPEDVSKALGIASTENLARVMRSVAERTPEEMLQVVDDLIGRGQDLRNFCRDLMAFIRDLLVFKIAGDAHGLLDSAVLSAEEMKERSAPFLEADLIRFFNSLSDTEVRLRDAAEPRYVLEIGLVKLIEMRRVSTLEEILLRVSELEERSALPGEEKSRSATAMENMPSGPTSSSEKKTLKTERLPRGGSNDVTTADSGLQDGFENHEESPPETANADGDAFEAFPPAVTARSDDEHASPLIDPALMPIRLPPISPEELEHADDPWLDAAYERALQKEGDDLSMVEDADVILGDLVSSSKSEEDQDRSNDDADSASAASGRAYEIIAEMTRDDDDAKDLPQLPENPTESNLREYAENHPLVKKAKRLMRARIVEVTRD